MSLPSLIRSRLVTPDSARLPSRAEIRQLVADHQATLGEVVSRGGNPHQASLDHLDRVHAYAALLAREDALAFLTMVTEESDATRLMTERETAAHEARETMKANAILALVFIAIVAAGVYFWVRISLVTP